MRVRPARRAEGIGARQPLPSARADPEGEPIERLAFLARLVPVARDVSWVFIDLARRYLPELRDRRERVRDLFAPFQDVMAYLVDRVNDEQHPSWRERLFDEEP